MLFDLHLNLLVLPLGDLSRRALASSRHERHRASSVPDARTETLILLSCVHLHLRGERDIFMLK